MYLAKGQRKKRCVIDSFLPQKRQVSTHFPPLFNKKSLVKILFLSTNQMNVLTLRGILIFHMNLYGIALENCIPCMGASCVWRPTTERSTTKRISNFKIQQIEIKENNFNDQDIKIKPSAEAQIYHT
jgi:hypothetical protein